MQKNFVVCEHNRTFALVFRDNLKKQGNKDNRINNKEERKDKIMIIFNYVVVRLASKAAHLVRK